MNKYQREKAKRKKKLTILGIGQYQQKNLLKENSFEEIDTIISQITLLKNSDMFKDTRKEFKKLSQFFIKTFSEEFNKIFSKYNK